MPIKDIIWKCPVCTGRFDSEKDALRCRNSHNPTFIDMWNCKYCGAGFSDHDGYSGLSLAQQCEQEHIDGNNVDVTIKRRQIAENLFALQAQNRHIPLSEFGSIEYWLQYSGRFQLVCASSNRSQGYITPKPDKTNNVEVTYE